MGPKNDWKKILDKSSIEKLNGILDDLINLSYI